MPPSVVQQIYPAAPDLHLLTSTPLFRMYGVWEHAWWTAADKTVDDELGWIIPVGERALMISYTDGDLARHWYRMREARGEPETQAALLHRLRHVFPDRRIPDPSTCTYHYWPEGVHFFQPRTDPRTDKQLVRQWTHGAVPLVGEAYALQHGWVEGALSTACSAVKAIKSSTTHREKMLPE